MKNKSNRITFREIFKPGYICPTMRAIYFFLFLAIIIIQTYCSLLMEEQLSNEQQNKYSISQHSNA